MNKKLYTKVMSLAFRYYKFLYFNYFEDVKQQAYLIALANENPNKGLYKLARNNGWYRKRNQWHSDLMNEKMYRKYENIYIGGY